MRQSILILLALIVTDPATADVIFQAGFEPAQPVSGQVVISPGFKLLTTTGETAALSAEIIDEVGGGVSAEIYWHSNDPATVSVTQDGTVTAHQPFGSAQIIASAPGAAPATILVTIATPAAGALLVPDEQVVEPPAPVDPMAPYGLGYEYTIVLQGIPTPVAGEILIGTGETPLAGRVVAASADMGQVTVTLEVIALDELFATLVIDERLNLERAPIEVDPGVEEFFEVTRYDDGSIVLSPLAGAGKVAAALESLLDCGDSSIPNPLNILTVSAGGAG